MSYVVLARKYRPKTFDEVVGQGPIARTLKNAIAAGRVAHAYLFAGPRGVGKTSMARIFAMALNCSSSDAPTAEPCGKCASCNGIFIGEDVDVREIDGASNNSVDDVRTLRDNAAYRPAHSRNKIYIIDEVHMLSKEAFNALLKTLEEPPDHVKFIFATTEPHKLPETIHSRCQRFDFKSISTADIVQRLKQICKAEKVNATDEVLKLLARRARGGMRDSQSTLDQLIAYSPGELTADAIDFVLGRAFEGEIDKLLDAFAAKDAAAALRIVDGLVAEGQDLTEFLAQILETLRTMMVLKACKGDGKLLDLPAERVEKLAKLGEAMSMDTVLYMLQVVGDADRKARTAVEKRLVVETAMVKLATMEDLKPLAEILERLQALQAAGPAQIPAHAAAQAPARPASPVPARPAARGPSVLRQEEPAPVSEPDYAPEPPVEEAAPAPTASGPLGDVQAAWPRVLALIKSRGQRTIAAFMKDAVPTAVSDAEITIVFPAGFSFHRTQLADPERLIFVETCVSEVVGRKVRLRVADEAGGKTESPAGKPAESKPVKPGRASGPATPGVQRAVEMFGGRVMEEEK